MMRRWILIPAFAMLLMAACHQKNSKTAAMSTFSILLENKKMGFCALNTTSPACKYRSQTEMSPNLFFDDATTVEIFDKN